MRTLPLWLTACVPLASLTSRLSSDEEEEIYKPACEALKKQAQQLDLLLPGDEAPPYSICKLPWDPKKVVDARYFKSSYPLNLDKYVHHPIASEKHGQILIIPAGSSRNSLSLVAHYNQRRYILVRGVSQWVAQESHYQFIHSSPHPFTVDKKGVIFSIDDADHFESFYQGRAYCFDESRIERNEYKLPLHVRTADDEKLSVEYLFGIYHDAGLSDLPPYNIQYLSLLSGYWFRRKVLEELNQTLDTKYFDQQLCQRGTNLVLLVQLLSAAAPDRVFENARLEEIRTELFTLEKDAIKTTGKAILLKACKFVHDNSDDHLLTLHSLLRILKNHEPTLHNSILLKAQFGPEIELQQFIKERADDHWSDFLIYYRPLGNKHPNPSRFKNQLIPGTYVDYELIGAIEEEALSTFGTSFGVPENEAVFKMAHYSARGIEIINSSFPGMKYVDSEGQEANDPSISGDGAIYIYRYNVK